MYDNILHNFATNRFVSQNQKNDKALFYKTCGADEIRYMSICGVCNTYCGNVRVSKSL